MLADIWHSPQLSVVHRHPLLAVLGAIVALGAVVAAALVVGTAAGGAAGAVLVALPFRIPIQAGGTTSNLLVPLYFVVAAGALAFIVTALRGGASAGPAKPREPDAGPGSAVTPACWLERLLAAYVVLYALQAAYSLKFETALQQVVFFYVPFALAFCLLRRIDWTPRLTRTCLGLLGRAGGRCSRWSASSSTRPRRSS